MSRTSSIAFLFALVLALNSVSGTMRAQTPPDLSGTWESRGYFGNLARDLKPGELLMQPWAEAQVKENQTNLHKNDPMVACMPPGVPRVELGGSAGMPHPMKIVQTPSLLAKASPNVPGPPITIPGYLKSLMPGDQQTARNRLQAEDVLSFAAIDPPASPQGGSIAAKIQVIAIGGGIRNANAF